MRASSAMGPVNRELGPRLKAAIAASAELKERDALKSAGLAAAMTSALKARGVPDPIAHLAGEMGVLAFKRGYSEWLQADHDTAGGLARRPDPMLEVRLFANARFSAAAAAIALAFFGLFGFIFLITQYFQLVRGWDPLRAGVATLPFALVTGAMSPVAIAVMKRAGTKLVVASGLLIMSGGFALAATLSPASPYWGPVIASMTLMAAGLALITSPATDAISGALPPAKAGAGSAVNDFTRELGGALGVAVIGSVTAATATAAGALGALLFLPARASQPDPGRELTQVRGRDTTQAGTTASDTPLATEAQPRPRTGAS